MELSIILRELAVFLFNLRHFLFGGGYLFRVPKSCFQELFKSWQVFEPNFSILPDVWQDLTDGYPAQAIECIPHLRLLVGKAGRLVSYDHPELSNPASQQSSI